MKGSMAGGGMYIYVWTVYGVEHCDVSLGGTV